MKRVIYVNDQGNLSVIIPTEELSIEECAKKDVPAGVAYKIVDVANVPDDRTFRAAWEADISEPDGYGIGPQAWFIEQYKKEIERIKNLPLPTKNEEMSDDEFFGVVGMWEQSKIARIEILNKQIEVQEKEMSA